LNNYAHNKQSRLLLWMLYEGGFRRGESREGVKAYQVFGNDLNSLAELCEVLAV